MVKVHLKVSDDSHILAKLSFDQWNLIFLGKNEDLKAQNLCQEINENSDLLATNISDAQVFFQISGENTYSLCAERLQRAETGGPIPPNAWAAE